MEIGYEYERIADELREQIRSGRIPKGGKLPGELELAEQYGVATGTVRRAVQVLRGEGLVKTLAGKGTFVV